MTLERENLLLFDNNVYRKIIQRKDLQTERAYVVNLNAAIMGIRKGTYTRIMTPFGAMEALGIKIQAKPPLNIFPTCADVGQRLSQALDESIQFFAAQEYLSSSALLLKLEEQLKFSDDDTGIQEFLADTLVRTVSSSGFSETLHSWLGFDHVLQISNWGLDSVQVNTKIMLETFRSIAHDRDLPLFRLMYRVFAWIEDELSRKGKNIKRPFKLESREDYLDTDVVHYPILGLSSRPRARVTVITEENYLELHNRLVWAKMAYNHWSSIIDENLAKFKVPRPVYGEIFILKPESGHLSKRIKVKKLGEGHYLVDDLQQAA